MSCKRPQRAGSESFRNAYLADVSRETLGGVEVKIREVKYERSIANLLKEKIAGDFGCNGDSLDVTFQIFHPRDLLALIPTTQCLLLSVFCTSAMLTVADIIHIIGSSTRVLRL